MPWTEITREQYRRDELRYASDMTDAEWGLIERLLPRANQSRSRAPSSPPPPPQDRSAQCCGGGSLYPVDGLPVASVAA